MKNFSFLICSIVFISLLPGICSESFAADAVNFESEITEGLTMPLDVVISGNGQLFVLDAGKSIFTFAGQNKSQSSFVINNDATDQAVNSSAVAFAPSGRLVVADTANSQIKVFNLAGELLFSFGVPGSLPGQFKLLNSVEVDAFDFIYAADHDNKRIQIFTPNGIFFKSIALSGSPNDVAVDRRGNVYALLADVGKIEKFSSEGKKISEITCKTNKKDEIQKASRLQIDPWGNIYLTLLTEERIVKIDQSGNTLISFGSEGNARGQFLGICGLAVDETGRVYVSDSGNARLQIFKVTGPLRSMLPKLTTPVLFLDFESTIEAEEGINDIFSLPGKGLFGVSDVKNHVGIWNGPNVTFSSEGAGAGQLLKPAAIYVALNGRSYLADTENHRVQIFNYDGSLHYEFGKNGSKPGQFNFPQGIAVNSKGMILVADTLNDRIEVFNQDGIFLNIIGHGADGVAGPTEDNCSTLKSPKVLAVDFRDQVYVVDADTTQVKVFDENGQCLKSIGEKKTGADQFKRIVDIAVDQNDNLYVADSVTGQVQIFDPAGKFLLAFGSVGTGNGYFKQLSSVAASEGRVFVADYQSKLIQVFRYSPDGLIGKTERLNTTKTASPSSNLDHNDVLRYTMARKDAYNEAVREFSESLGFSIEYLSRFVRIDSVESLNDGKIKVTISIPKFIPREIKAGEHVVFKSGG